MYFEEEEEEEEKGLMRSEVREVTMYFEEKEKEEEDIRMIERQGSTERVKKKRFSQELSRS